MTEHEQRLFDWPWSLGKPACHGVIRSTPEDFIVDEVLGFSPDGEGNHAFLRIRKRNANTEWLARQLADLCAVPLSEVGYAGLKDRHAVTTQYFTVNLSGKSEPDWSQLDSDEIAVLEVDRHRRKLRRGRLQENRFSITLRELEGECDDLERRLRLIVERGIPNYFGEQRFGHHGANLQKAQALFRGEWREPERHKRGLYLSAARSWLFNRVLAARVERGCWDHALPGESMITNGTTSAFSVRILSREIEQKVSSGELHPSGPLWGRGKPTSLADALALEMDVLNDEPLLREGLEKAGMEQERRPLRVKPRQLQWQGLEDGVMQMQFTLPPGSYATSLLRELAIIRDAHAAQY